MSSATGVYQIRNTVNGKVYVGSASRGFNRRWRQHLRSLNAGTHHNQHLQAAWSQYTAESFTFEILVECPPESCVEEEQKYIDLKQSWDVEKGYNICPTAGSQLGYKHTEASRSLMSQRAKSYHEAVPEAAARLSQQMKQHFTEPENLERHRRAVTLYMNRPDVVERNRQRGVDRFASQEYRKLHGDRIRNSYKNPDLRKAQSDRLKAQWASPEFRENYSAKRRGKRRSPIATARFRETMSHPDMRAKMSSRSKALWTDPEYAEKTKKAQAAYRAANPDKLRNPPPSPGRKMSEETKVKISEVRKSLHIRMSEDQKRHLSELRRGSKDSQDTKDRKSARAKEMWADPVMREKILSRIKGSSDPAKRSEAQKRRRAAERAARESQP